MREMNIASIEWACWKTVESDRPYGGQGDRGVCRGKKLLKIMTPEKLGGQSREDRLQSIHPTGSTEKWKGMLHEMQLKQKSSNNAFSCSK